MLANFKTGRKICSHCKVEKNILDFPKNNGEKDGLGYWCKACHKESSKNYSKKFPERIAASNKKWREKEKNSGYQKRHYDEQRKKIIEERQLLLDENIKIVKAEYGETVTALPVGFDCKDYCIVDEADVDKIMAYIGNKTLSKHQSTNSPNHKYVKIQVKSTRLNKKGEFKKAAILLHRIITDTVNDKSRVIDHVNNIGYDNRRCNIRVGTTLDNQHNKGTYKNNKSGFRGVFKSNNSNIRHRAYIMVAGKQISLGVFKSFELAKEARIAAELKYYGDCACKRS